MPTVNLSIQVIPLVPDRDAYRVVDIAIDVIKNSGVKFIVGPMETTMEGELEQLMEIVKEIQGVCIDAGAERVLSNIKIDYHPMGVTIDEKISKYRS